MGRMPVKGDKLELLTTVLDCKVMVGECVSRFLLEKEMLIGEVPLRKEGRPLPLCNISAWVVIMDTQITARDRVEVRGKVEGKVLFAGEGGSREITVEEEEFNQVFDVPGARPGMDVFGHGRISYLGESGPPQEMDGKLLYNIEIEVEVLLMVVDHQQVEVAVGAKSFSPEKLERQVIVFEELLEEKAFPLTLASEPVFPGELAYLKILSYYLDDFDWKEEKEIIHVQGTIVTWYYYSTNEKDGFMENRQFFKEVIPVAGLVKGSQVSLYPSVEYVVGDPKGEHANQRAYIDILIRVTRNVQQEVLLKIEGVDTHNEYLLLPRATGMTGESMEIVKRIDLPYPKEIAAGPARLRDLQTRVEDSSVAVSGILERYVYYIPPGKTDEGLEPVEDVEGDVAAKAGGFLSLRMEELFQQHLHLPGVGDEDETLTYARTGKCEFAPAEAATLTVSHSDLEIKVRQLEEYAVVVPSRVAPETSLIIYAVKKGDNLLKIARSYGVNAADVAESNGLTEDDVLQAGQKLLIPLMLYRR